MRDESSDGSTAARSGNSPIRSTVVALRRQLAALLRPNGDVATSVGASAHGAPVDPGADGEGEPAVLLTPEERVVQLVERNGGEMEQAAIVEELPWSESTISRKLSKLERNDTVTRYQIGRGKLVFLPSAVPPSLQSPLAEASSERSSDV